MCVHSAYKHAEAFQKIKKFKERKQQLDFLDWTQLCANDHFHNFI